MDFWQHSAVVTLLFIGLLLLVAETLVHQLVRLRSLAIPGCILAGLLGLVGGPDLLGWLPLDRDVLETVVYHGLAVVFISLGLQNPARGSGKIGRSAKSFTLGIPVIMATQAIIGLGLVLLLGTLGYHALHPGLGGLLPYGFEEGPGQALSLGHAWEEGGLSDGGQLGLIIASIGFGWAVVVGVPLVAWGRRKGLVGHWDEPLEMEARPAARSRGAPGSLDRLSRHIGAVAGVYALTWVVCWSLSRALAFAPDISATIWGFHFIFGATVALLVRPLLTRREAGTPLDDDLLGTIAGSTVDIMTCAALAAIQIAVFKANWLPILVVTSVGGIVTLVVILWLSSRVFPDAPFEHAVLWFGMSTGTLPMGLALLRIIDPNLRSPAPMGCVLGSAGSIPFAIPILMLGIPMVVAAWPDRHPGATWIALPAFAIYAIILLMVLWRFGDLRIGTSWRRLWEPSPAETTAAQEPR
jgi:ESS family glutamate:Na+ symporter